MTTTLTEIEPVTYAVQTEHGGWRVAGTRILLESIIYAYREGKTPEEIVAEFSPSLTLEQVHGATAFYLRYRDRLDKYMSETEAKFEELRSDSQRDDPGFYERMRAEREKLRETKAEKSV